MRRAILFFGCALATVFCAEVAHAHTTTTQDEYFSVSYFVYGSSGPDVIQQYSGPLTLKAVRITWNGYAYSGYDEPGRSPDVHFKQHYVGGAGFYAYSDDPSSNFNYAYDFKGFSGKTDCTLALCEVGGSRHGVYVEYSNLAQWIGNGQITIDSQSEVAPEWCCDLDNWFHSGVEGKVTYYLQSPGVPEPTSWAMMVGGFISLGHALRRGRRISATYA